jgi:hypothetical protein
MDIQFKLDYFILVLIQFFSLYTFGFIVEKKRLWEKKVAYWRYAIIPILLFVCIEGLRYGRGADYLWYQDQFYSIKHPLEEQEFLFMLLYEVFYDLHLEFHHVVCVFAFVWILSIIYFIQSYAEIARYGIVFYLIASLILYESAIRQCLGFSCLMLGIPFLFCKRKNNYVIYLVWVIIAACIHTSSIIYSIVFLLLILWNRPINWKCALLVYLFFVFIWDFSKSDGIAQILSFIDLGENKMQSYINNADSWFEAGSAQKDVMRSISTKIMAALLDGTILFYGYKLNKVINTPKYTLVYNVYVIGMVGLMAAFSFEIVRRVFQPMYFFWGIIAAYSIIYRKSLIYTKKDFCMLAIMGTLVFLLFVRNILLSHAGQLFIWDVPSYKL